MLAIGAVLPKLGMKSLARVALYRLRKRVGLLRRELPEGTAYDGSFLTRAAGGRSAVGSPEVSHKAFSSFPIAVPHKAGWHSNCLTGTRLENTVRHWTEIPDFGTAAGDIKTVWEPSRFDWLPVAVSLALESQDEEAISNLDAIVADWVHHNPLNTGPNWKCGQETALRCLNFLLALRLIGGAQPASPASIRFVDEHIRRVAASIGYAIGQDNNHAISEAVAFYVAGRWLEINGDGETAQRGRDLARQGCRLLERGVARLVLPDGTFVQYSVVYHRMLLALLSLAELVRRDHGDAPFSAPFIQRAARATAWLAAMVDPATGDAPNLGANDGTFLFNLDQAGYRDFRPAVDLASGLFGDGLLFGRSRLLELFGVQASSSAVSPDADGYFPDGGFLSARRGKSFALLRIPRFLFRPSQADGLHLDLWHDGVNVIRDGGSFSYADQARNAFYSGTSSHSTVEMDGRDQMPRIGRFLFGSWLKAETLPPAVDASTDAVTLRGGYRDKHGARHARSVDFREGQIVVADEVSGFEREAVLRWRLAPGDWRLEGSRLTSSIASLEVTASVPLELRLVDSMESTFYLRETPLPVLEAVAKRPGTVTTVMTLSTE